MSMDHDPPTTYRELVQDRINRLMNTPRFWLLLLVASFIGFLVQVAMQDVVMAGVYTINYVGAAWFWTQQKWGER